jgi:hypothetical protein
MDKVHHRPFPLDSASCKLKTAALSKAMMMKQNLETDVGANGKPTLKKESDIKR